MRFTMRIAKSLLAFCFLSTFILAQSDTTEISKEDIQHAEKIIGVSFTDAERDSMLSGVIENLTSYKVLHSQNIENSIPPAVMFNPIPVGYKNSSAQQEIIYSDYSGIKLPENKDDLAFYSIGQLAELLRTRQIGWYRVLIRKLSLKNNLKC